MTSPLPEKLKSLIVAQTPLGRIGTPEGMNEALSINSS